LLPIDLRWFVTVITRNKKLNISTVEGAGQLAYLAESPDVLGEIMTCCVVMELVYSEFLWGVQ
jgi:hypothetical protein